MEKQPYQTALWPKASTASFSDQVHLPATQNKLQFKSSFHVLKLDP
jgi:hypothetical protein